MLSTAAEDEKSILEFSRETGRMLGPPEISDDVTYVEFVKELLQPAVEQLQDGKRLLRFASTFNMGKQTSNRLPTIFLV